MNEVPAMKTCPRCAEEIKAEAEVCKHCGYDPVSQAHRTQQRTWLILGLAALLMIGLYWNERRLDQQRAQHDRCVLLADMQGSDPGDC